MNADTVPPEGLLWPTASRAYSSRPVSLPVRTWLDNSCTQIELIYHVPDCTIGYGSYFSSKSSIADEWTVVVDFFRFKPSITTFSSFEDRLQAVDGFFAKKRPVTWHSEPFSLGDF